MKQIFFKADQTVYNVRFGNGVVKDVAKFGAYPVWVVFGSESDPNYIFYTPDGKEKTTDLYPSLFQKEPFTEPNQFLIEFEKFELVWAKDMGGEWFARYFFKEENGLFQCFINQKKHGATSNWKEIRKFEDNHLV